MMKVTNDKSSICWTCAYHHNETSCTCHCMYYIATNQRRGCPVGMCDKYEKVTPAEHKAYWKMVNHLDNNKNKPNKFTLNFYRYYKKKDKDKDAKV